MLCCIMSYCLLVSSLHEISWNLWKPKRSTAFRRPQPLHILRCRLHTVKSLPGAQRLLRHLAKHSIPVAVATSTPRASYNIKMQTHGPLVDCVAAAVCGDEVDNGKPAPDTFLKAAELLKIDPSQCLAFEDAPSGIQVWSLYAHSVFEPGVNKSAVSATALWISPGTYMCKTVLGSCV